MKLFLKQQLPVIILYASLTFLLVGLFWLDGYHEISILIYGIVLAVFVIGLYLLLTFFSQRNLYKILKQKPKSQLYQDIDKDIAPLSQAVNNLLNHQYQLYFSELKKLQNNRDEHTRFINQWVHQMKTPLAVIELMIQDGDLSQESLLEEVDRIRSGLSLALNMARLESFQQDFVIEKVNLKKLAIAAVAENKRHFIRNYVYPKIDIDETLEVETDLKWLSFCLSQILSNSIKYSANNNKTIEISGERRYGQVHLSIRDFGSGIAKSDLPRVFQPFFTGEQGRSHQEATGIGLYLVHEVINELDHQIEIQSKLGEGTVVTIII